MDLHFPALIIIVPLLSAFLIVIAGWLNKKYCFPLATAALGISLLAAIAMLGRVMTSGPFTYRLAGWAPPWGIEYNVDHLSALVLVVVAAVACINLIATQRIVQRDFSEKTGSFYGLYSLFVTGLLGVVITGDAFNLFVLLEITALTGYALIGMGSGHAPLASLNYIFMGTIGASFYLLGIGYLYLATGTLNMADLAAHLVKLPGSKVVLAAFLICLTGLFMKMALFPLHAWLPNAYVYAPSAAVGIIAPLTTKVMVYVLIRITLFVFTPEFTFARLTLNHAMVWLAVIAIVMGSILALAQKSLKKMLVYIIVAEVGYMVGGLWLGNRIGITGSILHIVNDAAMTLCVFLAAGSLLFKLKADTFGALRGSFRKMPITMTALVVGGLSIIGVPPTCGFFSKWYLITGALDAGQYQFVVALLLSSLINVVLFFRIIEFGYFEPSSGREEAHSGPRAAKINEAPLTMVAMLLLVSAGLIALGLLSGDIVTHIILPAIPAGYL
jgi:multicomponent Na+:H+ antiporter subunit D